MAAKEIANLFLIIKHTLRLHRHTNNETAFNYIGSIPVYIFLMVTCFKYRLVLTVKNAKTIQSELNHLHLHQSVFHHVTQLISN